MYRAIPRATICAEFIKRGGINFLRLISRTDNRAVDLFVADRAQLDAQVSAEDTLGPLSTHRRQRPAHQRSPEGGAQDVYLPGGHFHRRHSVSESAGERRITVDLCITLTRQQSRRFKRIGENLAGLRP